MCTSCHEPYNSRDSHEPCGSLEPCDSRDSREPCDSSNIPQRLIGVLQATAIEKAYERAQHAGALICMPSG